MLSEWKSCREDLKDSPSSRKRKRLSPLSGIDPILTEFIERSNSVSMPLTDDILAMRAGEAAQLLGHVSRERGEAVAMSPSWITRFKRRCGYSSVRLSGEIGSNNRQLAMQSLPVLRALLSEYAQCDIYNFDETALFWRCIPNVTVAKIGAEACHGWLAIFSSVGEFRLLINSFWAEGTKQLMDRITVGVFSNSSGCHLNTIVIGKSKYPRCFRASDRGVRPTPVIRLIGHYYSNKKAWMTQDIFNQVIIQFDTEMSRSGKTRVCVLLDNAPSHKIAELEKQLKVVKLVLLPKNTTAILQPNDQGIIRALKAHFKRFILRLIYSQLRANPSLRAPQLFAELKVTDALDALHAACEHLRRTPNTIRNGWVKSGLSDSSLLSPCSCGAPEEGLSQNTSADFDGDLADATSSIDEVLQSLSNSSLDYQACTASELLDAEVDWLTHEPVSIYNIIDEATVAARRSSTIQHVERMAEHFQERSRAFVDGHLDLEQLCNSISEAVAETRVRF